MHSTTDGGGAGFAGPAVQYVAWGHADAGSRDFGQSAAHAPLEIVGAYGSVELEYAALRRGCGLIDQSARATIVVTGSERIAFLNRMLTQEMKPLAQASDASNGGAGAPSGGAPECSGAVEAFWLNRKGRIDADLFVVALDDRVLIDLDATDAEATLHSLEAFLFTEDVELRDASDIYHRLSLHGPSALEALSAVVGEAVDLAPLAVKPVHIAGANVIIARRDQVREPGLEFFVQREQVTNVWNALLRMNSNAHADECAADSAHERAMPRPLGWFAFNVARIEAGTPIFHIDFGPENLPHESGVLRERVSFTKGCYPGQEVVARMEHLGKPKQRLVGLRMDDDALPAAGDPVLAIAAVNDANDGGGHAASSPSVRDAARSAKDAALPGKDAALGRVTSSTLSPMLGARPIAFAMVRTKGVEEGTPVIVPAEGMHARATITALRFWGHVGERFRGGEAGAESDGGA